MGICMYLPSMLKFSFIFSTYIFITINSKIAFKSMWIAWWLMKRIKLFHILICENMSFGRSFALHFLVDWLSSFLVDWEKQEFLRLRMKEKDWYSCQQNGPRSNLDLRSSVIGSFVDIW
jgi:hypothetical protein